MYMFGQTSSIWLRCSLHVSKTFCKSFTVRYSFRFPFRADILSPNPNVLDRLLFQMFIVLKQFPSTPAQDDLCEQVFICSHWTVTQFSA